MCSMDEGLSVEVDIHTLADSLRDVVVVPLRIFIIGRETEDGDAEDLLAVLEEGVLRADNHRTFLPIIICFISCYTI